MHPQARARHRPDRTESTRARITRRDRVNTKKVVRINRVRKCELRRLNGPVEGPILETSDNGRDFSRFELGLKLFLETRDRAITNSWSHLEGTAPATHIERAGRRGDANSALQHVKRPSLPRLAPLWSLVHSFWPGVASSQFRRRGMQLPVKRTEFRWQNSSRHRRVSQAPWFDRFAP
jgi:hypothetical protein